MGVSGGTLLGGAVTDGPAADEVVGDVAVFLTVARFSFSFSTAAFRPRLVKGRLARPVSCECWALSAALMSRERESKS